MKTSQFMDKQIMDLTASGSAQSSSSKDDLFLDLLNNHLRPPQHDAGNAHGDSFSASTDAQINYSNLDEEDKIFPSYDFQPISGSAAAPRAWTSADSKSSPLNNYASLDSVEPRKEVVGKERAAAVDMAGVVSEVDRAMKKHADNLLHVLEGVSARLTQLESRTRSLESSVDDLKVSVGNNHGSTDGKMRQMENILREVQSGVQVLKDKQEMVEAQLQLSKMQVSKEDQPPPQSQNTVNIDATQQAASAPPQSHQQLHPPAAASTPSQSHQQLHPPAAASAPPQSHQQLHPPVSFPQSMPPPPPPFHPPPVPQQNLQPPALLPSQFPPNQIHPTPQRDSYFPPPGQEPPSQQYQVPTSQPLHPPSATLPHPSPAAPSHPSTAAPPHQPYQPPPQSQYPQQPPPPQPQPSLGHHPEETSYIPSQSYPPNLRQPSSQPPSGAPPSQQYYGASMYEPPSSRPGSTFSAGYGAPPVGPIEPYPYGGSASQYGGSPAVKPPQLSSPAMSQGGGSGYPQLPTARILPQALPTASGISGGSNPSGTGNRVPIDDVVDRVTTMGFPREQVRATVRKLTENGQSVDLNIVLDKLMNGGEGQSQRGWFGR